MKPERLEILQETVQSLNNHFKFDKTFDVVVDDMGLVMKGTSDPSILSDRLSELVSKQGFTRTQGELAEVFSKEIIMVGSIVVTRRYDRDNTLTLGVTV